MERHRLLAELVCLQQDLHKLQGELFDHTRHKSYSPIKSIQMAIDSAAMSINQALEEERNLLTFYNEDLSTVDLSMDFNPTFRGNISACCSSTNPDNWTCTQLQGSNAIDRCI